MRSILLVLTALFFSGQAMAHQAFTLVSSEKKIIKDTELKEITMSRTLGKVSGSTLTFAGSEVRLVVFTGPEDDMLSYRIQGIRNPTLVVPSGATLRILFVNVDGDMKHDLRLGHVTGEFAAGPDTSETAGSQKLLPVTDGAMNAEEMVVKSTEDGVYKYFCSVGSHAKGGMWGNIAVGVTPEPNIKMPEKTKHNHSPDEDEEMKGMPNMKPGPKPDASPTPKKPGMEGMSGMNHGGMKMDDDGTNMDGMRMSSVTSIGDPMTREASGTSWNPDSTPMYARMKHYKDGGMLMLMGTGFLRYTSVGSNRDVSVGGKGSRSRADAPTMLMAMYSKPLNERSQIGFRGMFSLDPVIESGYGYPLLYQSGEQYRGRPIHDRQHPHDLISELAITYSYKFNDKKSFYVYAGYPGEPALGPPMYLHRNSGMNNPDAPIGHHWQDATHITFGVVTAGFSFGKAKIEASAFNGTEPNENRYNFDRARLNSFSGRFSFNPTKNWALQISHGYLKNPEPAEPEIRILRKTTASAIYNKVFDENRNLTGTLVWGQNYANGQRSNSFLLEGNFDFYRNAVFGRLETVKKSGHDLVLPARLANADYQVQKFSLGFIRDVYRDKGVDIGLGGMFTMGHNPPPLAPIYGGTDHGGWQLFMRFRPSKTTH